MSDTATSSDAESKQARTRKLSSRSFLAGAAMGAIGCYAVTTAIRKPFRSSANEFHGERSNCYWIESAGIEGTPLPEPLRDDVKADIVIVGGGYTGLATAFYLAEAFPEKKIVVLESARVGYGASGRNDGLVLPLVEGAETVIDRLIEKDRIEEAREVFEKTSAGIGLIEALVNDHGIDCEWEPRRCLIGGVTESQVRVLEEEYRRCTLLGFDSEWLTAVELQRRINVEGYRAAFTMPMGSTINPAKLANGMLRLVRAQGASVYEGSRAVEILPGDTITVRTPGGSVTAPTLILATNAYTSALGFFRNRVIPIHSYSISTEPLSEKQVDTLNWQERQPFHDVRNFFELFRLTADNRVVFSGGEAYYYYRDALRDDENHADYERLRRRLRERFPLLEGLTITHQWCGLVGLTLDRIPMVGVTGPSRNIFYGLGYSGHGVPVSFLAGRLICDLYSGNRIDPAYDFFINHRSPAAPPEPLKSIGFALYKRYLHWRDLR